MTTRSQLHNVPRADVAELKALSYSQKQIWLSQKLYPESPFCNMAFAIKIDGRISVDQFQKAWKNVVDRNELLRIGVIEEERKPYLKTNDNSLYRTDFLDFSTESDPQGAFNSFAEKRSATAFSLEGPLIASTLVKLSEDKFGWFLNQHHILTDAASTVLLVNELSEEYQHLESTVGNKNHEFDYLRISTDLEASLTPAQRSHWIEKAKESERFNPLLGNHNDPKDTNSTRLELSLSVEQSKQLRKLTEEPELAHLFSDVSLFAVFSTLLTVLIQRVTGQSVASFDTPSGNRSTRDAKRCLGCFIEMFPFDVEVSSSDTFRAVASRCMNEAQTFLSNATLGASTSTAAQLSNVVLNYFPQAIQGFAGYSTHTEWIHSGHIEGNYDLKLQVHDYNSEGRFILQLDLSDSTFSPLQQSRIQGYLQRTIDSCIHDFDTAIGSFDILDAQERHDLIQRFNRTDSLPPPQESLLKRIAFQASSHPDRLAIREGAKQMTYRELWSTVEKYATDLVSMGVGRDSCVVINMPRSLDAVIAILSVLRSGGAFIPIDPSYPPIRVEKIISDSGSTIVLYSLESITASNPRIQRSELPLPQTDSLAYVIYTSGSTGQPKGVEIEHRGLADYIDWAERSYVGGEQLSYPLFTSLAFDLTITSLFLPLVTGGELIVYPQKSSEVDSAVVDVINENAVDFLKLTPSHLSLLRKLDLSSSRISRLVLGGEDLKQTLASAILDQFSREVALYNEYGPTECVVGCMIHRFDPVPDSPSGTSVPIGIPADHVSIYLLNEQKLPVPQGTPGEMSISRNGLARGYRNDSEKTALSFIPNPFDPSQRLYRTGDLARFSDPRCLTYLGRIDKQIKLRGHRIELGEIESTLLAFQGIRECYVAPSANNQKQNSTSGQTSHCTQCGIASNYPNIVFNEAGVCSICNAYQSIKKKADTYFQDRAALLSLFDESRKRHRPRYDCMVFFSGGKDSAYALANLVDLGLKVYAFTLDNGYLSEQAIGNINRVVEALGVEHEYATTSAMNEIFRDSLTRYSNVCNGCFKTIYTLGLKRAHALGIPIIVTGLSRGQFYETRLTENLFRRDRFTPQEVDTAVLEARKRYHREEDAVSKCLDVSLLQSDEIFERIQFVDFYRYWDAPLEEIYNYLSRRLPWIRPQDTGRSTNCRVNDVGIYIHKKERGFHNYALPYSWDVRLGQKRREEAIEELDDKYDVSEVREMLAEIGYDEDRLKTDDRSIELVAYYVAEQELDSVKLVRHLEQFLPAPMRPRHFVRLDSMPLTTNGKVDPSKLPDLVSDGNNEPATFVAPQGPVEEHVSRLWSEMLSISSVGSTDNFFRLGGTSLTAMEITLQLCQDFEIDLPLQSIFSHSTVGALAAEIERVITEQIEQLSDEEAAMLVDEPPIP